MVASERSQADEVRVRKAPEQHARVSFIHAILYKTEEIRTRQEMTKFEDV